MKLRFAFAPAIAALVLSSGAMADPPKPQAAAEHNSASASPGPSAAPTVDTIVQIAAITQEIAQFSTPTTIAQSPTETGVPADKSTATRYQPEIVTEPDQRARAKTAAPKPAAKDKLAAKTDKSGKRRSDQPTVASPLCVRAIGKPETGTAAWYGGRYVGRRTSSGERLDTVHATAAHRTLPLNSLARVTNLNNGRSVVVRVTDRGPMNDSLLIDMSPRAADELRMKEAGLVRVTVEQVVEVPPDAK